MRVAKNAGASSPHLPCNDLYVACLVFTSVASGPIRCDALIAEKCDVEHRICSVQIKCLCKPRIPPHRSLQRRCKEPKPQFFATQIHPCRLDHIAQLSDISRASSSLHPCQDRFGNHFFFIGTYVVRKFEPQTKSRLRLRVTSNS